YDLVATAVYRNHQTIALGLAGESGLKIGDLTAEHILTLAEEFGMSDADVQLIVDDFEKRLGRVKSSLDADRFGSQRLKTDLMEIIDTRWNETFSPIAGILWRKQTKGGKGKLPVVPPIPQI